MPRKTVPPLRASVIIPAYNAEKTLQTCLDGLMQQAHIPDEIIVVDDGSTDNTKTIAEAYSLVTLLSQKNLGPAKARNAGAARANGNVIVFLDSDCVPEKNWLDELLKPFANEKVVGVQGAYKTRQTGLVAQFDQADIEYRYERMKRAKKLDWIGSYSAAYRRKIFLEEKGFDESFPKASGEDAELSYRLAEKGFMLVFAPNAIVYHTHPDTVRKYFTVKFFRAFWRARMYRLHPKKMLRDSYTPSELKVSVLFGFAFIGIIELLISMYILFFTMSFNLQAYLLLSWFAFTLVLLFVVLGFVKLLSQIYAKNKWLLLPAIGLIVLRSIAFAFGLIAGILDKRVRA